MIYSWQSKPGPTKARGLNNMQKTLVNTGKSLVFAKEFWKVMVLDYQDSEAGNYCSMKSQLATNSTFL